MLCYLTFLMCSRCLYWMQFLSFFFVFFYYQKHIKSYSEMTQNGYQDPLLSKFEFLKFSTYVPLTQYHPNRNESRTSIIISDTAQSLKADKQPKQQKTASISTTSTILNSSQNLGNKIKQQANNMNIQRQSKHNNSQADKTNQNFVNTTQIQIGNVTMRQVKDERSQRQKERDLIKTKESSEKQVERQNEMIKNRIIVLQELEMIKQKRVHESESLKQQIQLQCKRKAEEENLEKQLRQKHEKIQKQKQRKQLHQFLNQEKERAVQIYEMNEEHRQPSAQTIKLQTAQIPDPDTIRSKIHALGTWLLTIRDHYRQLKARIHDSQLYREIKQSSETGRKQIYQPIKKLYQAMPIALTQFKFSLIAQYPFSSRILFTGVTSIFLGLTSLSMYRKNLTFMLYPLIRNTVISYGLVGFFITPEIYFPLLSNKALLVSAETVKKNNK